MWNYLKTLFNNALDLALGLVIALLVSAIVIVSLSMVFKKPSDESNLIDTCKKHAFSLTLLDRNNNYAGCQIPNIPNFNE